MEDLGGFYSEDYNINSNSEEEDQLYLMGKSGPVFRTDHQVSTFLAKVAIPDGSNLLEFGCAKAASLRKILQVRPDVNGFAFDVSEVYKPFWETFIPSHRCAVFQTPDHWDRSFDCIACFFVLEHVVELVALMGRVKHLLKPGGRFYALVPNCLVNTADFVVLDHVNHFTENSLRKLAQLTGFEVLELDSTIHDGGIVLQLLNIADEFPGSSLESNGTRGLGRLEQSVESIAKFWSEVGSRVRSFECHEGQLGAAAIYGSGFYGTFVGSCLTDLSRVTCFLDLNPHRYGQNVFGKPILHPKDIPGDIKVMYVGLRPDIAAAALMSNAQFFSRQDLRVFLF